MSATRYSGDLTITLTYRERSSDYRATITWPSRARAGTHRHVVYVGEPKYLRHGVDSPEAFDETAHAAISFASEEEPEIGERASPDHAGSGWHVGRSKKRAWPIPPEQSLADPKYRTPHVAETRGGPRGWPWKPTGQTKKSRLAAKPLIDDRNYTVVGINGYRSPHMTLEQARRHADKMQEQMKTAGWAGKVRIYYRDGSEVK